MGRHFDRVNFLYIYSNIRCCPHEIVETCSQKGRSFTQLHGVAVVPSVHLVNHFLCVFLDRNRFANLFERWTAVAKYHDSSLLRISSTELKRVQSRQLQSVLLPSQI